MKKVLIALLSFFAIVACDKSDDNNENIVKYTPNKYRVKQIKGNTEMWGDFTLDVKYSSKNQLEKSYCYTNSGDTISVFSAKKDNSLVTISLHDYLKDKETEKYTNKTKLRYKVVTSTVKDKIEYQTINTYKPKEIQAEDDEKVNDYINVTYEKHIYEYSEETGNLLNHRLMLWKYNQDPEYGYYYNTQYDTYIYKNRVNYDGRNIINIENYTADGGVENSTNYRLSGTSQFNYTNGDLVSISDGISNRTFTYSGNKKSIKIGDTTKTYVFDDNGNVVKISDDLGHSVTITYESGFGNFETILPLFETIMGVPVIK